MEQSIDVELQGGSHDRYGGLLLRVKVIEGERGYLFGQGGPGPGKWLR
jgi:hypothetical protein